MEFYNFSMIVQECVNGFFVFDYMFYGLVDVLFYFNGDVKCLVFLEVLVSDMQERVD